MSPMAMKTLSKLDKASDAGAVGFGVLGITKGIVDGIQDAGDYCLDAKTGAEQTGAAFGRNLLNLFGGLGDIAFGAFGYASPLEKIQNDVQSLNSDYRTSFDSFTQSFASSQTSINGDIIDNLYLINNIIYL